MEKNHYFDFVYEVTLSIPKGRVSTYGAIADYLALGSARMVGWALNKCHNSPVNIPAHRVVNSKGELSGRMMFKTPTRMADLLTQEGVQIKNDKVVAFKELFWHPRELNDEL